MPSLTVGPLSNFSTLQYSSAVAGTYAQVLAQAIANGINTGANNGGLTQFVAPAGQHTAANGFGVAGEPASGFNGIATFRGTTTPQTLFVNGADQFIVVDSSSGPVSLQGGAAGGSLLSGAGAGLTYTNITPTGSATDNVVALGGNNLIQTATFGSGNYVVQTGDGNDTVNILLGNATVDAGAGRNVLNLGTGSSLIGSEGYDTITGVGYGSSSGVDTINIGSGQTSINSGGTSFLINDSSVNPLLVTLGSGVDTINYSAGSGGATVTGINTGTTVTGGVGTISAGDTSTGDLVSVTGALSTAITARGGNDTINGVGDSGNSRYTAGTGSTTILAGVGNDTLIGATGANATGNLMSGKGAGTTFQFTYGQQAADVITGFKATDVLSFVGFGANPLSQGPIGTSGGTAFNLADGTTITFVGSTNPTNTGTVKTS